MQLLGSQSAANRAQCAAQQAGRSHLALFRLSCHSCVRDSSHGLPAALLPLRLLLEGVCFAEGTRSIKDAVKAVRGSRHAGLGRRSSLPCWHLPTGRISAIDPGQRTCSTAPWWSASYVAPVLPACSVTVLASCQFCMALNGWTQHAVHPTGRRGSPGSAGLTGC